MTTIRRIGTGSPGPPGPQGIPGPGIMAHLWTNITRPSNPVEDLLGYNTEEQRPELYVVDDARWYYLWQAPVSGGGPSEPSLFTDGFEVGWFTDRQFNQLMSDGFDWPTGAEGWTQLYADSFEIEWFNLREFAQLATEGFESGWFIDHPFSQLFSDGFEGTW